MPRRELQEPGAFNLNWEKNIIIAWAHEWEYYYDDIIYRDIIIIKVNVSASITLLDWRMRLVECSLSSHRCCRRWFGTNWLSGSRPVALDNIMGWWIQRVMLTTDVLMKCISVDKEGWIKYTNLEWMKRFAKGHRRSSGPSLGVYETDWRLSTRMWDPPKRQAEASR